MKNLLFCLLLFTLRLHAQNSLPVIDLPKGLTVHIVSPEPIQYVDISDKNFVGDLPLKNVLRVKMKDSSRLSAEAVLTIAGEKFIAQYRLRPCPGDAPTEIEIRPPDTRPLDISGIGLSAPQLKSLALGLVSQKPSKGMAHAGAFGIKAALGHIYTVDDYLFLDVSYENKTNLKYDIDGFRFTIDDKKFTKATNVQSLEIQPEFVLFDKPSFKKHYRNIFVFKKMSFAGNKILHIELSERQLSGRIVTLDVSFQDILEADSMPLL
jgi:conjugative transposon TraN protein